MQKIYTKTEATRHLVSTMGSVIAIAVVVLPAAWYVVRPTLVSSISVAMASDIEDSIDKKLAPIEGGFIAIISQNIARLRREISAMEYRQMSVPQQWTPVDAADLTNLRIDLDGQETALRALQ